MMPSPTPSEVDFSRHQRDGRCAFINANAITDCFLGVYLVTICTRLMHRCAQLT
jgi:hypothetical protein